MSSTTGGRLTSTGLSNVPDRPATVISSPTRSGSGKERKTSVAILPDGDIAIAQVVVPCSNVTR